MDELPFELIVFVALAIGLLIAGSTYWRLRNAGIALILFLGTPIAAVVLTWPKPDLTDDPAMVTGSPSPKPEPTLSHFASFIPEQRPTGGYVTSTTCAECHSENHASWHASYHRTMTQYATPKNVIGKVSDVEVFAQGRHYKFTREGEVSWVEMNDPDEPVSPASRMKVPLVLATGSHHMQIYWYPTGMARMLAQLPIVYLKETQQWIPRTSAFLEPADTDVCSEMGRWNGGCSQCHTTHRRERWRQPGTWDTKVSEFGISCEACHGPGEPHIAFHRTSSAKADTTGIDPIVNPSDLSSHRASEVCGQCHSINSFLEKSQQRKEDGHSYRPGLELSKTHSIWHRDSELLRKMLASTKSPLTDEQRLRRSYWDDGMVRVSGREFNGLVESSCYTKGELSCMSCHSLHQSRDDQRSLASWTDDQLSTAGLSDEACTQCHAAPDYGTSHTHHAPLSSGSRCYNCHMPHTTYGLLKAIRSHTISSPNVEGDLQARRPGACNLCHLDQTLGWTAKYTKEWYGAEMPTLSKEQESVAAAVLWTLKGDAGQRALAAWSMGWPAAQEASGTQWITPILAQLLDDPYDAVRIITRRSLRSLPGLGDESIDALAPRSDRMLLLKKLLSEWHDGRAANAGRGERVLIGSAGLQTERVKDLLDRRDNTRVRLIE